MSVAARRARMASPLLAPNNVAGLTLWFKASTVAGADAAAVTTWPDSSGNARDASQGTAGKRPTIRRAVQNGQDAVRFDGGDGLSTAQWTPASAQPNVAVAVVKPATVTGTPDVIDGTGSARTLIGIRTGWLLYAGGGDTVAGATPSAGVWVVVSAVFNTTASSVRVNGVVSGTGTLDTHAPDKLFIGYGLDENSEFWNGDIAEVCFYDVLVTTGELQRVERGLGVKYGIGVA